MRATVKQRKYIVFPGNTCQSKDTEAGIASFTIDTQLTQKQQECVIRFWDMLLILQDKFANQFEELQARGGVYIAVGATDMRKSVNELSLIVEEHFELDLFSGSLFAFCNRKRTIIKILYWAGNGFCVWMKKLEEEIFRWPESEHEVLEINSKALGWLLDGLDLDDAHRQLNYKKLVEVLK